jgi:hypothetical protein
MTTVSTQQLLNYILENISNDFNIDLSKLKEKYGSLETIYKEIQTITDTKDKNTKKKVIRKVNKTVEPALEEPKTETVTPDPLEAPIEAPKKKVVRKVTKTIEPALEEPKQQVVTPDPLEAPIESPKKKVVRKVTKNVEPALEEPKTDTVAPEVVEAPIEAPKKKVVRKVTKTVETVTNDNTEEKVKPNAKRIVKKVPSADNNLAVSVPKNTKPVDLGTLADNNSLEGRDELEENIYVDTQIYNDEDSDSLEPREINGVKYYIDSSNYIYDIESQDIIGKLNEKGDSIIFLSDFSSEK